MSDGGTTPPEPEPPAPPPMPAPPVGNDLGFGSAERQAPIGLPGGSRVRPMVRPESGIRRTGGILMVCGAAAAVVSLPLPLFSLSAGGVSATANGMVQNGFWIIFISGFAFLRGYSAIKPIGFRTAIPILSGALIVWATYEQWQLISEQKQLLATAGQTVAPGIGFVLLCLGAALIVAGSVILQFVPSQRS
jgi:hypothetical protein